ncbi:MAG: hypothetical protein JNM55_19410 [Anaerolineales bacterium]|nr:hypothetical protein [Anaerolineales bacterium]
MDKYLGKISLWVAFSYAIVRSGFAFNEIAWGTGSWWGLYSLKWGVFFSLYVGFCVLMIFGAGYVLCKTEEINFIFKRIVRIRERAGNVRWFLVAFVFVVPAWFFQYTPWGVVFSDIYIRLVICFLMVIILAFLFKRGNALLGWPELFIAILLASGEFVIVAPFMRVTDYPFSLGWSEGNRLWDYSIMFGRGLYNYPADKPLVPFLDVGRQFVGGLPFLLPTVTIEMERFWVALLSLLPYLFLGFAAFQFERKNILTWGLLTLWTLIFVAQGPIHTPLVIYAVLVVLVWRRPLWIAAPLVFAVGFMAVKSRFTWMFAPGIWIAMLEFAGASLQDNARIPRNAWVRGILLGLAGTGGGYLGPKIIGILMGNAAASVAITTAGVTASVSEQPLLWYRLLPNATYGIGILVGLLLATLPLVVVLLYMAFSKRWIQNIWQGLIILASLISFLAVGLIVSTKIGGGGDLHNMDMFIIGLLFTAVIAWEKAGKELFLQMEIQPLWIKSIFILLLFIPGVQSLGDMRSFDFAKDLSWIATLKDVPSTALASERSFDMYPSDEIANSALEAIRMEVELALSQGGEVLFLDQRQLLTFGYVKNVPLVPEYEKKVLMNQALSSDKKYFQGFYDDLAKARFQLIISEFLRTPVQDSSFEFGEENNAWVKWVSTPVLCYYEAKIKLKEVGVELFVPKERLIDCAPYLPK